MFSLGSFFKWQKGAEVFGLIFSTIKITCIKLYRKMRWATLWATFSQTHLVTLV
jgi:hypothetical protein